MENDEGKIKIGVPVSIDLEHTIFNKPKKKRSSKNPYFTPLGTLSKKGKEFLRYIQEEAGHQITTANEKRVLFLLKRRGPEAVLDYLTGRISLSSSGSSSSVPDEKALYGETTTIEEMRRHRERISQGWRNTAEKLELKEFYDTSDMPYQYLPRWTEKVKKHSRPVVVFDIETGGNDEVVSLAAAKVVFDNQSKRFMLLDTYERAYYAKDYTSKAWRERQAVHGITKKATAKIRHQQHAKYGKFYDADEVISFMQWIGGPNTILTGHNADAFDIPKALGSDINWNTLDTLVAIENIRGRGGNKLHQAFERLTGLTMESIGLHHHAAMSDVIATAYILQGLGTYGGRTGHDIQTILNTPGLSLGVMNQYINSQVVQGKFGTYLRDMTAYLLPGEIQKMAKYDETESIANMIPNAGELIDAAKAGVLGVDENTKKRTLAPGFSKKRSADEGPLQDPEDRSQDAFLSALQNARAGINIDTAPILATLEEIKSLTAGFSSIGGELQKSSAALQYSQRGTIVSRLSKFVDMTEPLYRPKLESMKNWIAVADYLQVPNQERIRAYKASYAMALRGQQEGEDKGREKFMHSLDMRALNGTLSPLQADELKQRVSRGDNLDSVRVAARRASASNVLEGRFSLAWQKGELSNEQIDYLREGFEKGWSPAFTNLQMKREMYATKQEQTREKESLKERALSYKQSLSPWEKAGMLSEAQVRTLTKEALSKEWTPEQGESRRNEEIHAKELADKVWRAEQVKDAVKSGRITASQGKKIEDSVVVNDQLAGAIDKAAQATKGWISVLQAFSQIPIFNPERIHEAYASGISSIGESSASVIPNPLRKLGSRFGRAVMENDLARMQYFRATDKTLRAASPLLSAAGSVAGAAISSAIPGLGPAVGAYVGSMAPGAIQGTFALGTQIWGNYKEAGITKMFQQMSMRFDILGTMIDFVTMPLAMLAKTTKLLRFSFLGLGDALRRITFGGLDKMSQLGNPLTHLTGINYAAYQAISARDAFFGSPEGSLNSYEEDFRRQAELLYSAGQYDQRRLANASRLGLFNEVYGPNASFEATVNTLLKRDLTPSEMSLLHAINPQLAPTYELLKKAGATDMGSFFAQAGAGINLNPLSDKQQVAFKKDVYQRGLIKKGMDNSMMIIADKLWTGFGKDILSALNDVLHSLATGSDWDNTWKNFKASISKAWDRLDWNKIRQIGGDAWTGIKTKVLGMDEDTSLFETAKNKVWSVATKLVDVWISGVSTAIDKLAPIISDFINWFNTIELHPENIGKKGKEVISFARALKDSDNLKEEGITNLRFYNPKNNNNLWRATNAKTTVEEVRKQAELLSGMNPDAMVEFSYENGPMVKVKASELGGLLSHPYRIYGKDYVPTVTQVGEEALSKTREMVKIGGEYVGEGISTLASEIVRSLTDSSLKGRLEVIFKGDSGNILQKSTVDLSTKNEDNRGNIERIILNTGMGGR